jgi:hypothetical protein
VGEGGEVTTAQEEDDLTGLSLDELRGELGRARETINVLALMLNSCEDPGIAVVRAQNQIARWKDGK